MKTLAALALALLLPLAVRAAAVSHEGRGVVRAVKEGGRVLVIEHEAIPGFMEAMTMPFEVADPGLTRGLKVGDRIRFTLTQAGEFWPVTALRKLPPAKAHRRHRPRRHPKPSASPTPMPADMPGMDMGGK